MLTLAIDCALRRVNLGLSEDNRILGELSCDVGIRQAEVLPESVGRFLSLFGYDVGKLNLIGVTAGPGYFTGIRIGLAYAAALAESVGARVVSVSTLLAMSLPLLELLGTARSDVSAAPVITAGKESVYAAVYRLSGGEIKTLFEPSYVSTSDFIHYLQMTNAESRPVVTGITLPEEFLSAGYTAAEPPSVTSGILKTARSLPPTDPADIRASYLREPG